MNILVTGAAGFIGSHLFNRLCINKHKVVGIDSFVGSLYSKEVKETRVENFLSKNGIFERCDVFDERLNSLFDKYSFDVVVHLAAHAGVRPSINDPEEYYRNNVLGTNHLLNVMLLARDLNGRRIYDSKSDLAAKTSCSRHHRLFMEIVKSWNLKRILLI